MIPYKDDNPTRTFPFVTVALIAVNCLIYLWQATSPLGEASIAYYFGAIPQNILSFHSSQPISPVTSVFTAMFLHGGDQIDHPDSLLEVIRWYHQKGFLLNPLAGQEYGKVGLLEPQYLLL